MSQAACNAENHLQRVRRAQLQVSICNAFQLLVVSPSLFTWLTSFRRRINPRVLASGTLLVQCSNAECLIFHKVVDHLHLFHELAGPVFTAPSAGARKSKRRLGGVAREDDSEEEWLWG